MFTQGHRVTRKLERVKFALNSLSHIVVMVIYVREMTLKKSFRYREYGLFEHLLFMFVVVGGGFVINKVICLCMIFFFFYIACQCEMNILKTFGELVREQRILT